ncbi:MAG: HTH domain-containing protein, partial [Gammaproteobacteria bacterium]
MARPSARSAVWKAIETLRADGLAIEAATNRGYRLAASCEALDAAALRAALSPQ